MIISALSSITLFIFLKSFALIPCFSFSSNSVPFHVNLAIPPLPSTCTCTGSCSLLKKKNEKPKNLNTSGIKLFFYCYYAAKLGIIFDTSKYFIVLLQNLSNKIRACAIAQALLSRVKKLTYHHPKGCRSIQDRHPFYSRKCTKKMQLLDKTAFF